MSFKDVLKQQLSGMETMATTGIIGLHLVSGPLVGFGIGYGLDFWFETHPWCKMIFLFVGIAAGFLNVYHDTQHLLRKMAGQDTRNKEQIVSGGMHDEGRLHPDGMQNVGNRDERPESWPS